MGSEDDYAGARKAQKFFEEIVQLCMEGNAVGLEEKFRAFAHANDELSIEDMITKFKSEGKTILHIAAGSGNLLVLDFILKQLKDPSILINAADAYGFTPLIYATISESNDSVKRLLKLGANVTSQNIDGAGPIHFAAGDGDVTRISILLDSGADPDSVSKSGTALHWAAGKGHSAAIRHLLSRGANVRVTSGSGISAAFMAAAAQSDESVALLVEAGADVGSIVTGNVTLLHICAENGLRKACAAIIEREMGKKCCGIATSEGNLPVHLAAMAKDRHMVELLLPYSPPDILSQYCGEGALDDFMRHGKERMREWEKNHGDSSKTTQGKDELKSSSSEKATALSDLDPASGECYEEENESKANIYKDKGNNHFRAKEYSEALGAYSEGLKHHRTNHVLYSNRSACFLAAGDAVNALKDAEICRRLQPNWVKGCYRLAAARMALKRYEDAAVAAFEGCKLEESNVELKKILQEAVRLGREEHRNNTVVS